MLNKPQLETMALRWAKAYRPGLLPELNREGPKAAQAWATQKATQVLEDYQTASGSLEQQPMPAPQMQTRLRSLWEQVLADHFPATLEWEDQSLPPRIQRQVQAAKAKMLKDLAAKGLDEGEAMEVWESMRPSLTEDLLEQDDAERVDAGVPEEAWAGTSTPSPMT